ncbi:MAG: hypothetical protein JXP73_09150 [Deltaproteobacteria bacterium]|nr:hypothetical protein [Deltaproteobacteria bacterium]
MSLDPGADIFGAGRQALAQARQAFGGQGCFFDARALPAGLVRVPYAFGEPEADRQQRLASLAQETTARSSIVPTPVGQPQGLDTIAFFAACRLACPRAHLVADLDLLGLKLGPLCLSFGADAIVASIVAEREPRLGGRASSREVTRDEAAQMLRASGFAPYERAAGGKACPR